jgi:hypothetical protein
VEVQFYVFFTSALDGGEWLASHPGRFKVSKVKVKIFLIQAVEAHRVARG